MSDFVREVDEEVRQDRFRQFLNRYWAYLLGLVLLILAAVGAWRATSYWATEKAQVASGQYLDALDLAGAGKIAESNAALNTLVANGPPGYGMLSRFRLADNAGLTDVAAGAKLFDALAQDATVEPMLQNLARFRAALLLVDTAPYPDIKQRLDPLADANNGLRNSARELLALAALKANQGADAERALGAIEADAVAPAALRQRADALMGLVRAGNPDQVVDAPSAAVPPAAPVTPAAVPLEPGPAAPSAAGETTPVPTVPPAAAIPAPEASRVEVTPVPEPDKPAEPAPSGAPAP